MSAWPWISASLQAVALAGAVLAVTWLFPRAPPSVRAVLWWCVALRLLLTPFAEWWAVRLEVPGALRTLGQALLTGVEVRPSLVVAGGGTGVDAVPVAARARVSSAAPVGSPGGDGSQAPAAGSDARSRRPGASSAAADVFARGWPWVLAALWAAGAALRAGRLLRDRSEVRGWVEGATPADPALCAEVDGLARRLELSRLVQVRVSDEAPSPFVAGAASPVLVLPAHLAQSPSEARRMAIAHELWHVRRSDLLLGWVPMLAEVVLWFHPLSWLAAKEYVQAREEDCDAAAVRVASGGAPEYGRLLLEFGVSRHAAFSAPAYSSHVQQLKRRLKMLALVPSSSRTWWALVGVALFALVPFEVVAHAPQVPAAPPPARVVASAPTPPPAPSASPSPSVKVHSDDEDELAYVRLKGPGSASMSGSGRDLRYARRIAEKLGKHELLYVREDESHYVIDDPKLIARFDAIMKPADDASREMGKFGAEQGALGEKQAELGLRQAELGAKQAELAHRQAKLSLEHSKLARELAGRDETAADRERERKLEAEQEAIGREMEALGEQQEDIGREQEQLGREQEKIGDRQEAVGETIEAAHARARVEVEELIDEAVRSGAAKPAPR